MWREEANCLSSEHRGGKEEWGKWMVMYKQRDERPVSKRGQIPDKEKGKRNILNINWCSKTGSRFSSLWEVTSPPIQQTHRHTHWGSCRCNWVSQFTYWWNAHFLNCKGVNYLVISSYLRVSQHLLFSVFPLLSVTQYIFFFHCCKVPALMTYDPRNHFSAITPSDLSSWQYYLPEGRFLSVHEPIQGSLEPAQPLISWLWNTFTCRLTGLHGVPAQGRPTFQCVEHNLMGMRMKDCLWISIFSFGVGECWGNEQWSARDHSVPFWSCSVIISTSFTLYWNWFVKSGI